MNSECGKAFVEPSNHGANKRNKKGVKHMERNTLQIFMQTANCFAPIIVIRIVYIRTYTPILSMFHVCEECRKSITAVLQADMEKSQIECGDGSV